MPHYLSTSQEYLHQSSLLLEAYPDTTRITTKYSYPKPSSSSKSKSKSKSKSDSDPSSTSATESQTPASAASTAPTPATLTLKTYNPSTGIILKYKTNKGAEVSRLIAGLGKLASGAPIDDTPTAAAPPALTGEDVEMADAPTPSNTAETVAGGKGVSSSGGGKVSKGKKKGGKGKR